MEIDCRAKHVWQILAERQRKNYGQTAFPLNAKLLNDLGFTKRNFRHNIKDLKGVVNELQRYGHLWGTKGPLASKGSRPGPTAYLVDCTLVIGPRFADSYTDFVDCSKKQDGNQR